MCFCTCNIFFSVKKYYIMIKIKCGAGVSRSSTIVIAYLIWKKKLSFEEAFNFVKENRSVICPNSGFI